MYKNKQVELPQSFGVKKGYKFNELNTIYNEENTHQYINFIPGVWWDDEESAKRELVRIINKVQFRKHLKETQELLTHDYPESFI